MKHLIASFLLLSLYAYASASEGKVPQMPLNKNESAAISPKITNKLLQAILININDAQTTRLEPGHYIFCPQNAVEINIVPVNEKPETFKRRKSSS